jgi:hypothetical protein
MPPWERHVVPAFARARQLLPERNSAKIIRAASFATQREFASACSNFCWRHRKLPDFRRHVAGSLENFDCRPEMLGNRKALLIKFGSLASTIRAARARRTGGHFRMNIVPTMGTQVGSAACE